MKSLRIVMSAWVVVSFGGCGGDVVPTTEMQPGDPSNVVFTNNETGETIVFDLHHENDENELVLHSEENGLFIRANRSELDNVDYDMIPGDFTSLVNSGAEDTDHDTHVINYNDAEAGHDFTVLAVVPLTPLTPARERDANQAVAAITITFIGVAGAICIGQIIASALRDSCATQCAASCGQGNVDSCDAVVGLTGSLPFSIGCNTNCTIKCK